MMKMGESRHVFVSRQYSKSKKEGRIKIINVSVTSVEELLSLKTSIQESIQYNWFIYAKII